MKPYKVFVLLVTCAVLGSCNAIKKLQQFYIDYNTKVVYPANIPAGILLSIPSPYIVTNSAQFFQNNNTSTGLIQSIKLSQLSLSITSPTGQTFSFLENVSVYLSTDSLPEVEIAGKQNISADTGTQLNLDVYNVELENYLKADKIKLRIAGTASQLLTYSVNLNIYSKFFVQANILAVL